MSGQHHIAKLVIHCSASEQTGRDAVRAIASTKEEIIAVISSLLDQYASIPETITIKKLHLDLGRLYVHELPTKLKDRLGRMLEAELKAFFDRSEVRAHLQQVRNAEPDPFELIHRYLRLGFDEHLQQDRSFDVERLMLELLQRDPQKLASVLGQAWSHGHARKRLQQLSLGTRTALGDVFPVLPTTYTGEEFSGSAFAILTHYYNTGYFPEAATLLRLGDLEALVTQALRDDKQKLATYIYKGLHQPDFLQRFAETLTLALLKEVLRMVPQLNHAWQQWQTLEAAAAAWPPVLLHFIPGKVAFLRFITRQHPQERAVIWLDYIKQEASLSPVGFGMNAYLRNLAEHVQREALPGLSDVMHYLHVAAASDAKPPAPEEEAGHKERALRHAAGYLIHGVVSNEYSNVSQLFNLLLNNYADDLKTLITAHWRDAAVRHRLAWYATVPQLHAITRLVWKDHASYEHWKMLPDTLQQYGSHYDILVREAYVRYYDYLSAYGHTSWTEARFTSWMKAGLEERPEAQALFLPSISRGHSLKKMVPLRSKGSGADEDRVLALVRFYYHTGRFPRNAGSLRLSDLEVLVHSLLQVNAVAFIRYFRQQLPRLPFATRLSETLSFSTLKYIVSRVDSFSLALREWLAWQEWLQSPSLPPAPVTPHTKMLFLQYVAQTAPEARLQTAHEYLRVTWSLQAYRLTFREWLQGLQQQQGSLTARGESTTALVEQLLQTDLVADAPENLPAGRGERIGLLERHLTGTEPYVGVSVSTLLQSLIDEDADALVAFLRERWRNQAIRAGLAQQAEAQALEQITALVWKGHSSYAAWQSFYDAVQTSYSRRSESMPGQGIRTLYYHYFEFLAAHHPEQPAQYFREWMYTNLREVLPQAAAYFRLETEDGRPPAEEDTLLLQHAFAQDISSSEALSLVTYYYRHGYLPEDSRLDMMHLEWLVNKSMELHSREVIRYVVEHVDDEAFATRLSETLSLTLLEKIVIYEPSWQQAFTTWKAVQAAFDAAALLRWLPLITRKRSLLVFVSHSSPAVRAQSLFENLPAGTAVHDAMAKVTEILRISAIADSALKESLLKEVDLRMAPSPHKALSEWPETMDADKVSGQGEDAALPGGLLNMPAEEITATEALALVKYYYQHRQFPPGSALKALHLEWVVNRSMEQHGAAIVQYIADRITDTTFVFSLAETMSWALLEKIVKAHYPWVQSFEAWQAIVVTLEQRTLLHAVAGQQRKIFMLAYVTAPSAAEKAQIVISHVRSGENVPASVLAPIREALRDAGGPVTVVQEINLVMDALQEMMHTPGDRQTTEVEEQNSEEFQPGGSKGIQNEALMDFLLTGTVKVLPPEDMPALALRLLNADAPALAGRLRYHWGHQPLRYRITSLGRDVMEKFTQLMWGTHASYILWNTFVDGLSPQPDETLRRELYLLYFNYLHEHGALWRETHFRDHMVMALREYKHKLGDVEEFRNVGMQRKEMPQRVNHMLQEGLKSYVSKYYGRPYSQEDAQRFWDELMLQAETLFTVLRATPVKDDFWNDIAITLTVAQLRHLLYNLASFQFSHLDRLRQELQHFISQGATASDADHVIRTWYRTLFITLHKQGSTIGKNEAARLSVQQAFQEHSWINVEARLRHYKAGGTYVQQQFPVLLQILITLWPDLAREYLQDYPLLITPPGSQGDDAQSRNEGPDHSASAEAIKSEFASAYDINDLIVYYLKTGGFPSWSAIQTTGGLRQAAERLIESAPAAKLVELRSYPRDPEMDRRLKDLLSPAALTRFYGTITEDEGAGRGKAERKDPAPVKYSTDVVMERQRVELLLHAWIFQELPWWVASCDWVVEQDKSLDEDLLKDQVLQHHLEAFLLRMKLSPAEWRLAEKLMADVSLPLFYKIITARFPTVSGFVVTTFTMLNDSLAAKEITLPVEAASLYTFVYRFLLAHAHNFSSRTFIHRLFYFLWHNELERRQVAEVLFNRAESLRQTGDTRFWIISELLKEPGLQEQPGHEDEPGQPLPAQVEKHDDDWFGEALISYIRFGTIPSYTAEAVFTRQQLLDRLRHESPSVRLLIKSLFSNLSLLQAFVERADPEVVNAILALLSADRYAEFVSWKTGWVNFISWALNQEVAAIDKIAVKTLFALLQRKAEFAITGVFYLRSAFENLFREMKTTSLEALAEKIQAYKAHADMPEAFINVLLETVAFLLENERFKLMQSLLAPKEKFPLADTVVLEGRLPVQNAGIVIIGPFLYRYFTRLGMLEGNKFRSEEMALRAVHLLQFLVSGKTETPEHAMILNKILCGVEITTPMHRSIELTEEEREVSESLLHGVLENWDKLKTRSIDALREGFLMRDGYLEDTEMGWTLEVERKAMDILVDLIPWSFSMIKLAWMQKSLATTWQSSEYRDLMK